MARLDKKFDGRDSVVGVVFRYVLEGSGFRNLLRGIQNFPATANVTEAHSSSFKMDTCSLPRILRPGRGVNHPPSSSAEVKGRVKLHIYPPVCHFMVWYMVMKEVKKFPAFYDTNQNFYRKDVYFSNLTYVLYPVYGTNRDKSERSRGESLISSTVSEKLLEVSGLHHMPSNVLFCRLA